MKVLIAYGTRHGSTRACAEKLGDLIEGEVDLLKLEKGTTVEFSSYDLVIIGSPVYTGRLLREVDRFLRSHSAGLEGKPVGLYICCITPLHEAEKYLTTLYPSNLVSRACARGIFGGTFDFSAMNPVERLMIRRVKGVTDNVSTLSDEHIALFARAVRKVCPHS